MRPCIACVALIVGLLTGCGGSAPPSVPGQDVAGAAERCPKSAITRFADKDFSSPRWQRPMMNYQLAGCDINGQVPGAPDNEPWWDTMDFWIYEAPGALVNPDPMMVIYLHGTSQTPIDAALGIGWNELAERENIIVVYPHGLDGENNNWTWGETTAFGRVGQLESVNQITSAVQSLYGIGPDRTFHGTLSVPPLPDGCTYRIVVALTAAQQINPLTKKQQVWSINADVRDPGKSTEACRR